MARSPSRSPGKGTLVDTWVYDATYSATEEGRDEPERRTRKVSVELRLVKDFEGASEAPPMATRAVRFVVACKDIDLRLEGTDIEALRKAMWERLDARYAIAWEGWLLVKVDHRAPYEGSGTGFVFSRQRVERGVAFDGSVLLREYVTFGERGYRVTAWPEQFKEKNGRTLACIPETPGNVEALDEFGRRIDAMRRQLAEFLRPDAILETLANIQGRMAVAGDAAAAPRLSRPADADDGAEAGGD